MLVVIDRSRLIISFMYPEVEICLVLSDKIMFLSFLFFGLYCQCYKTRLTKKSMADVSNLLSLATGLQSTCKSHSEASVHVLRFGAGV